MLTHNNRIDVAGEGLDLAIRYGDGAWHGTRAALVQDAPLSPVCAPTVARRLSSPADLAGESLFRSYRPDEWPRWFAAAGRACPAPFGPVFDSSALMASAAMAGTGVALVPPSMFAADLAEGRLVQPFDTEVALGGYWLTWLNSRRETTAMIAFREWTSFAAWA